MFLVNIIRDLLGSFVSSFLDFYKRFKGLEKKLKIGFDGYPFLEPLTGIGVYSYNILKNLSKYDDIRINLYGKTFLCENEKSFYIKIDGLKNLRARIHGISSNFFPNPNFWLNLSEKILTPLFISIDDNDLFFAPNYFPPPNFKIKDKIICTVHDCTFKVYPEYLQEETLNNLNKYLPEMIYKGEKIICDSNSTKKDLINYFKVDEKRLKVIYLGSEKLNFNEKEIKEKPYLLFVSTIEPRKNLKNIIEAFKILKEKNYPFHFYIIGKIGWKCEDILREVLESPYKNFIHHLSYVRKEELGNYYKNGFCLLFPSYYEGFGLPILESFQFGCPVITSNKSSLPEVGGDACLYVETDPKSIFDGIVKLWNDEDLRKELINKGFERVKIFNWEDTTKKTKKIFESIL